MLHEIKTKASANNGHCISILEEMLERAREGEIIECVFVGVLYDRQMLYETTHISEVAPMVGALEITKHKIMEALRETP